MSPTEPIGGDRNPEEAAITGGVPPAAEPAPTTRDRRSSLVAPVWVYGLAGIALILTALLADLSTGSAFGTAILGVVLLLIAALSVAGVMGAPERGGVGIAIAALLVVLAFAMVEGGVERGVYLACAAAVLIAAFAAFAADRRPVAGRDEEPGPGVGSV